MGLDMYLIKKTYIGNDYKEPKDQVKIDIEGIQQERVQEIIEKIGYWRKANAIHQWFVDNVQDGDDNCQEHYVSSEKLKELMDTVDKVINASELVPAKIKNGSHYENGVETPIMEEGMIIKNPKVAMKLLPTQEGFFFGGYNYDQYYYEDLVSTKKILTKCLEEGGDYYYQSSW